MSTSSSRSATDANQGSAPLVVTRQRPASIRSLRRRSTAAPHASLRHQAHGRRAPVADGPIATSLRWIESPSRPHGPAGEAAAPARGRRQVQADHIANESTRQRQRPRPNAQRAQTADRVPPSRSTRGSVALDKRGDGAVSIVKSAERRGPRSSSTTSRRTTQLGPLLDDASWRGDGAELTVSPPGVHAAFTTELRHAEDFGIALPVEMREQFVASIQDGTRRVEGPRSPLTPPIPGDDGRRPLNTEPRARALAEEAEFHSRPPRPMRPP